jgi:2,3-bisphosphoglycerate-dependent phosphoglycerate mutase
MLDWRLRRDEMMTTVYFVRHAEPDHKWLDDRTRPLSAEGELDTVQVREYFKAITIDSAYCSPYIRSMDTIKSTALSHGLGITVDERLRERKAGKDSNNVEMFKKRWADLKYCEPDGESIYQVQQRNIEALNEILDKENGKNILIGTHGTALSSILNYYNNRFGMQDFLRIIDYMPFIVKLEYTDKKLKTVKEEMIIDKGYKYK